MIHKERKGPLVVAFTLSPAERAVYRRCAELALPRHTSYPIAPVWSPRYGPADFRADLRRSAAEGRPLSLYVHVPFCEKLCYYCACTKEIVPPSRRGEGQVELFLDALAVEADRLAGLVGPCDVRQFHLGGGSPTFLRLDQLERLWGELAPRFRLAKGAEVAVEVDPRITSRAQLATLRGLGFNRVSLGVQDFAEHVQRAVNRVQPFELVAESVGWCRDLGFGSINFDLIYGLPFQTVESMADTLDKVIALAPDRIAFFRLAVIPEMFRWQNVFRHADLPSGELSLDLNLLAINTFTAAGYEMIGLDHFARPEEGLGRARREGALVRNFQGMTTGKRLDLVGLGPSAISQLRDAFAQSHKDRADWARGVRDDLATVRGLSLDADDRLRQELLQQLYGHGVVRKHALEEEFGIDFDGYFADELGRLRALVEDGLVEVGPDRLSLTPVLGRLLVRVVAAVFDRYLPPEAYREGLPAHLASKVG
jgi:oxygen-independent coproporphyrinogen-3 oxidase